MSTLCKLTALVFAILLWSSTLSFAGNGASFEDAVPVPDFTVDFLDRVSALESRVNSIPAYQESAELKAKLVELRHRAAYFLQHPKQWTAYFLQHPRQLETEMNELEQQVNRLGGFEEQVRTQGRPVQFKNVRNRVATFTFDDPDQTGLGDPISFLLAKKMLFSTRVADFAIVNYQEGTARDKKIDLAYFDKVDLIMRDQGFLLAAWGRISRNRDGIHVDSFLQAPSNVDSAPYVQVIRLPEAMGNGRLTARLKPDRILVQSIDLNAEDVKAIQRAATNVAILRKAPKVGSSAIGELTINQPHRIVGSQGQWVHLSADNGVSGWTSVDAFCRSGCQKALYTGIFANDMLAITAGFSRYYSAPDTPLPETISQEAEAFSDQLAALGAVKRDPHLAADLVERWVETPWPDDTPAAKLTLPGEAGFANLFAVARIEAALQSARKRQSNFDRIRLEASFIQGIANDLATASVSDPADLTILDNLAVLYGYLGDNRRRDLALKIADNVRSR